MNRKNVVKSVARVVLYPIIWVKRQYMGHWLPEHNPQKLANILYKRVMGGGINWKSPKNINEKINWLKFYGNRQLWTRCADKYEVRHYVEERGLSDFLVNLYGKWDNVEDIDWNDLPDKFVLKINTGCGGNFFCKNKQLINKDDVVKLLNNWMSQRFSDLFVEPHYADIKPCVIAEELLDATKQDIDSISLVDYKVWCFNGKPLYIMVIHDRDNGKAQVALYDTEWVSRPEKLKYTNSLFPSNKYIPKPKCFDEMMDAASKLSLGHPQVRVDFYVINGKCLFGEMTFTSLGGYMNYYTKEMLDELGDMTDLNIG